MVESAGTLLYRDWQGISKFCWSIRRAPWSIPKGIPDEGEELEAAARRETEEETGVVAGDLTSLDSIKYRKSPKRIYCLAGLAPDDAEPYCASWEVDRAESVTIDEAYQLVHPDQAAFSDRLKQLLDES